MTQTDLERLKRYIQKKAHLFFPARELWMNNETGEFWGYDEDGRSLSLTSGRFDGTKILFSTTRHYGEDIEYLLISVLEEKVTTGFECFAVQV